MAKRLRNIPVLKNSYGGPMHNEDLKKALGVDPKKHWPDEGVPVTQVQGYNVLVLAKGDASRRALVMCPKCYNWYCAGHIGQHMEGRKCKEEPS